MNAEIIRQTGKRAEASSDGSVVCGGEFHRAVRRREGDHGLMEPEAASALLRGETDRAAFTAGRRCAAPLQYAARPFFHSFPVSAIIC